MYDMDQIHLYCIESLLSEAAGNNGLPADIQRSYYYYCCAVCVVLLAPTPPSAIRPCGKQNIV